MDEKTFKSCAFCPNEKLEQYKCSRCSALYCSLRCFRSKKHLACSEQFYREQCEQNCAQQQQPTNNVNGDGPSSSTKRPITTFEQYMEEQNEQQQKEGKTTAKNKAKNPQIAVGADEEILFDSDDEPEYLSKIAASTVEQFEQVGDDELNRRLVGAGMPFSMETMQEEGEKDRNHEQLEQLYQQLTEEEKKKFTELADGMFRDEFQSFTNCFRTKKNK